MSIIERSNPLNLAYKVAVVTNAATVFGQITCKTLLKANALVIGIDETMHDPSLTARPGTHFQFVQGSLEDVSLLDRIIELANREFGKDYINTLVNIAADDGRNREKFVEDCLSKMQDGSVVNVVSPELSEAAAGKSLAKLSALTARYAKDARGVRANVVSTSATKQNTLPMGIYESALEHMRPLIKTEKITKDTQAPTAAVKRHASELYDAANVALFLAGGMSENVSESVISSHGVQMPLVV